MATLAELVADGSLVKLDPGLEQDELEFRVILMLPRAQEWIENVLPTLSSTWNIEVSPTEQLVGLVADFASGLELTPGEKFHPIRPTDRNVWELKTADLRIFGWFAKKDCFVCVSIENADRLKQMPGLYGGYRDEVVRYRDLLALDEPKCVQGVNIHDVLSNCARSS